MEDFERVDELTRKRIKRRKRKRRQQLIRRILLCSFAVVLLLILFGILTDRMEKRDGTQQEEYKLTKKITDAPEYSIQLLPLNPYSRPGDELEKVKGIVVHYTANPQTTAQQNHNYFEGLAVSGETYASSHFIIGLSGEIIQCVPLDEIAYASNDRNADTLSIECCIRDDTGKFTEATYDALVYLTAWLVGKYDLQINDIIRHYDVTGKLCPKYFVEHPSAWEDFKLDVQKYIEANGKKINGK